MQLGAAPMVAQCQAVPLPEVHGIRSSFGHPGFSVLEGQGLATRPRSAPDVRRYSHGVMSVSGPPAQNHEWDEEFAAAARRPLRQRFRYAFIRTYKPVLDDARFRAFSTTREYREWCQENLPSWLGYGPEV
jgi:hypothetical protein